MKAGEEMKTPDKRADKSSKKLLDDFREVGADDTESKPSMTDKEYVEMMLSKERARRGNVAVSENEQASASKSTGAVSPQIEPKQRGQVPAALEPLKHDLLDSEANAKRKALETLAKHRKDTPPPQRSSTSQKPTVSEKVSPLRSCRNCYYCSDRRRVGGSWWCRCTNAGRTMSEKASVSSWVKGRINLPCWRPIVKSTAESDEPQNCSPPKTRFS